MPIAAESLRALHWTSEHKGANEAEERSREKLGPLPKHTSLIAAQHTTGEDFQEHRLHKIWSEALHGLWQEGTSGIAFVGLQALFSYPLSVGA